jgi:YHS domain-containing protein
MVRDPVCGLRLEDPGSAKGIADEAAYKSEYDGLTYYFCSMRCKQLFDEAPERHTKGSWLGGTDLQR